MPDAGGLVIAGDHADARAYAALLRKITGVRPVVVLSDDPAASKKIAKFAQSEDRWMVAVRMVSEGVDIPRLAVGVYATSVSTALFFAQAVGRFVRVRQRGETASVFLPSIPLLLGYAAELEAERDHVLARAADDAEERELAEAQRQRDTPDDLGEAPFKALEASAHFDRALYDGGEFGTSAEEDDFLGLPGLLEPEQVTLLLRKRQAEQSRPRSRPGSRGPEPDQGPGAPVSALAAHTPHAAAPARPADPGLCRGRRTARVGQGEPGRAAQGAQLTGHGLASPDRPAARRHPRRAAPVLRGAASAAGHRSPAPRADKRAAPVGVVPPLTTFVTDNSGTDPAAASRHHGDGPATRAHQVHRERAHEPVPGLGRRAHDHRVGGQLVGQPDDLRERVTLPLHELGVEPDAGALSLDLFPQLTGDVVMRLLH